MTSYDPVYFGAIAAIEDRHFWFRARNAVLSMQLGRLRTPLRPGFRALEVGCGTGNVLRMLRQHYANDAVVGVDLFREALAYARQHTDAATVQADVHALPFGRRFDLIGLFDVLEHLPDDHQTLLDLCNRLQPGGYLIVTVPAFPFLWSYFDVISHHQRRYTKRTLSQKLRDAGFEIHFLSYYMAVLLPLVVLRRLRPFADSDDAAQKSRLDLRIYPGINELLYWLLRAESLLLSRIALPFGASLVAVAHTSK